jgi:hypothetical protein
MSYRESEEQPSMWQQRGRGGTRAHHRNYFATRPEKYDPSFYWNEDQDTSADTTLVFATQGSQSGQRDLSSGKGGGNSKAVRGEIPRYQAQPLVKGGMVTRVKETTS